MRRRGTVSFHLTHDEAFQILIESLRERDEARSSSLGGSMYL